MKSVVTRNLLYLLLGVTVLASSCSSSKSYASRKSRKYSKSTYVAKDRTKTRASSKRNRAKSKLEIRSTGNGLRDGIVNTAKKYIGKKYVYGGKTSSGFDCSGFTSYVYKQNGIALAGPSKQQARLGNKISKNDLKRGDLLFFGKGKVSHVGIVVDATATKLNVIHATSSRGVVLEDISGSKYWQSRYLFGRDIIGTGLASN